MASSPQSSSPLADASAPLYSAPRFTPLVYPSWDAFSAALDAYMDQTFQLYICKTSTSSACRNQRMAKTHKLLNSGDKWLIPSEIKFYSKTMVCTHAGVRTSRGKGIRAKQSNRAMGCPAKMNVLTKKISGRDNSKASGWKVLVTQHTAMHNHPLDQETYLSYPQNRRVENPVVLEAVNALRNAGVKQGKIRKYITEKEPTKHVTRSDVNNLLQKMKDDSFLANMQRAIQSGLPIVASVAGEEGETGLADTEMPFESEGDLVGAAESARGSAATAVAPAAPNDRYFAASAAAERASRGGMPEPVATATSRQVEESISLVEPTTADFTLRSSNKVHQPSLAGAQRYDVGENDATSLQGLCDSKEISSGSFKLRVQRLEEQNLALFRQNSKLVEQNQQHLATLSGVRAQNAALSAQNATLVEQNRQHVADLAEAQKSVSDAQRQLIALRTSGVTVSDTASALTQEVATLSAEKAEWKQQDQEKDIAIASDSTEAQVTCGSYPRGDEQDGVGQESVQMPKRALGSSDSNSESELERPQKRASTQEKCTPRVP